MNWAQILTIVGANIVLILGCIGTSITLFLWSRAEAREDQAQLRDMMESNRKETNEIIRSIALEMREFHDRLCEIEGLRKR